MSKRKLASILSLHNDFDIAFSRDNTDALLEDSSNVVVQSSCKLSHQVSQHENKCQLESYNSADDSEVVSKILFENLLVIDSEKSSETMAENAPNDDDDNTNIGPIPNTSGLFSETISKIVPSTVSEIESKDGPDRKLEVGPERALSGFIQIEREEGPNVVSKSKCFLEGILDDDVDFAPSNSVDSAEFFKLFNSLEDRQQNFVSHVLECLRKKSPFYFFLSGPAGTGKSHTVKVLAKLVDIFYRNSTDLPAALVMAPTTKTASIIDGTTIEESLIIPHLCHESADLPELPAYIAKYLLSQLKYLKLIIIDEISSVGKWLLSHVNTRLKCIFGVASDFGNVPVLLVGDLNQVLPDHDLPIFQNTQLWPKFQIYELQMNFRQKEDLVFLQILNNFRKGELTDEDLEILNHRNFEISKDLVCPCISTVHLFCNDDQVACFNEYCLNNLDGRQFISMAEDRLLGIGCPESTELLAIYHKSKPVPDVKGLPHSLLLRESAKYMISTNLDAVASLGAGVIGYIQSVMTVDNQVEQINFVPLDTFIFPQSPNLKVSKKTRKSSWIVLKKVTRILNNNFLHGLTYERRQFPLIPAEAVEVRDMRGRTGSCICIPVNEQNQMRGNILYTALSRAKSLKDLSLLGCVTKTHCINDTELNARLRDTTPLILPGGHCDGEKFTICYQDLDFLLKKVHCAEPDLRLKLFVKSKFFPQQHDILVLKGSFSQDDLEFMSENCKEFGRSCELKLKKGKTVILFYSKPEYYMVVKTGQQCSSGHNLLGLAKVGHLFILFGDVSVRVNQSFTANNIRKFMDYLSAKSSLIVIGGFKPDSLNKCWFRKFCNMKLAKSVKSVENVSISIFTNIRQNQAELHFVPTLPYTYSPLCIQVPKQIINSNS